MAALLVLLALARPDAGTEEQMATRSERIEQTFNALRKDNLEILDAFYAPGVHFEDPLGSIEGLDKLKTYYAGMYENVQEITFEFTNEVAEGDTHVVVWTMRLKAKSLNRGNEVAVEGNSVIRFGENDLVVYHRDYFDMGAMVYEHVPVVRCIVNRIKKRLSHED